MIKFINKVLFPICIVWYKKYTNSQNLYIFINRQFKVYKMKRIYLFMSMLIGVLLLGISVAVAIPQVARDNWQAPDHSPVITEDGDLIRVDFIHFAKPPNAGSGKPSKSTSCYKLMGVKWPGLPVQYVINPTNQDGMSQNFVTSTISKSAETWDAATPAELFSNSYAVDSTAQYGVQDYVNTIQFGNYGSSNTIAVTSVWYTRAGKRIVEFDMLFNERYLWGNADDSLGFMDLQNIATHELGHSVGLDDLYNSCIEETMYGYSGYGETKKRTLEPADIEGLRKMYG